MTLLLVFALSLATLTSASVVGRYDFSYSVPNSHSHIQTADGDVVKGSYTVRDPDGVLRTVHYTADAVHGFVAHVEEENGDDGHYDHEKIHKDIDDGSYKHLSDDEEDEEHEHDHEENHEESGDDGLYDHARIHKDIDDGSYKHQGDDGDDGSYRYVYKPVEDDSVDSSSQKHRRDVGNEDDGQYHHEEENDGSYQEMESEGSDDGSYKLREGEDDGSYHETNNEESDDGSYRYVYKPHEGEDDGSYHEEKVEPSDDGFYKPEENESESDRLSRGISDEKQFLEVSTHKNDDGSDVSNRHIEELEGSGGDSM